MKKFLFATLAAAVALVGCNKFEGDTSDLKGKTQMVHITLGSQNLTSRAIINATDDVETDENAITEFTLWLLDADPASATSSNVVGSVYVKNTNTVSLAVPTTAAYVVAIANKGDLRAAFTASTTGFAGLKMLRAYELYTTDTPAETVFGNIPQSGSKAFNPTTDTSVTIPMEYIPARISIEAVTLFGENALSLDVSTVSDQSVKDAMNAAGISTIDLVSVAIYNVADKTGLYTGALSTPETGGSMYTDLYNADSVQTYEYGAGYAVTNATTDPYYPDPAKGVSMVNYLSNSIAASSADFTAPILKGTNPYPYFYVTENKPGNGVKSGATLVVFGCTVNGGSAYSYYVVPLMGGAAGNDYSTRRNFHYHITADIASLGSSDPWNPAQLTTFTLENATWYDGGNWSGVLPTPAP